MDVAELDAWMRDAFPVRSGNVEMRFLSSSLVDDTFRVVMELIVWDENNMCRDIKQQELCFCAKQDADPKERVQALAQAWAAVLSEVLGGLGDGVDMLMPHDLAPGNAIRLARSRTREDFEQALRKKSRLGRHL